MTQGYNTYRPAPGNRSGAQRLTGDGQGRYGMSQGGRIPQSQPPAAAPIVVHPEVGVPVPMAQAPQAPQVPQAPERKRKRGAAFWVAIIVILICIVLAAMLLFNMFGDQKGKRTGVPGQLEGKTPEEVQAELNRVVEEGMFNISIASAVVFTDGTAPGELRIENVPNNPYLMKVDITLDESGQQVYHTDFIEPNNHIQSDELDVDLEPGTYDATALFTAYEPDTEEQVGQASAKITLIVQG